MDRQVSNSERCESDRLKGEDGLEGRRERGTVERGKEENQRDVQ